MFTKAQMQTLQSPLWLRYFSRQTVLCQKSPNFHIATTENTKKIIWNERYVALNLIFQQIRTGKNKQPAELSSPTRTVDWNMQEM